MAIVGFLALQPDFGQAALIVFAWSVIYFVAGAPMTILMAVIGVVGMAGGIFAYENSEHFARRIDGFLSAEVDPNTQLAYATDAIREGGLFGAGLGEGSVKWTLPDAHTDFIIAVAAEEYGLILVLLIIALFCTIVMRSLLPADAGARSLHPAGGRRAGVVDCPAGVHQSGRCGAIVAGQGNDAAFCQLWRVVLDRHGHCGGHGVVFHPHPAPGRYRRYPFRPASARQH
jgi:hypothetical protein